MKSEHLRQALKAYKVVSTIWVYSHFLAFFPTLFLLGMYGWRGVVASAILAAPQVKKIYANRDEIHSSVRRIFEEQGAF